MENWGRLSHLFVTVFLSNFYELMVSPAIPDVTLAAICPGKDECSAAIYLTGFQQAVVCVFDVPSGGGGGYSRGSGGFGRYGGGGGGGGGGKCYTCGQTGQFARECNELLADDSGEEL